MTGSESLEGAFRNPKPSREDEEALMFALNRVAAANRMALAAKTLVFANALVMGYSPE